MNTRHTAILSLLLLAVLFFAVNIAGDRALRRARVDLTDHKLFTLSDGTRNILREVREPITLTLFYSADFAAGQPQLQTYAKRVTELLEEFGLLSGGKVRVETVNPEPFSEGEEQAQRAGVQGLSTPTGEKFYFGLLGVNSTDGREAVPFFDPRDERFLEYTLARLVYTLDHPEKKKVAVLSSLPVDGSEPMMPGQQPQRPWQILTELRATFEVKVLDPGAGAIPDDAEVLLIIHPKGLGEPTLRAIDSFVIGGGRALIFVDPVCEADIPPGAEQNPLAAMQADRSSNLNQLLEAWGVTVDPAQVAADSAIALQGEGRTGQVVSYVQYMGPGPDELNTDDAVTGSLGRLQIGVAGAIQKTPEATTTVTPLIRTTADSMLLPAQSVSFFADPAQLLADFVPRGEPLTLAARITGNARSAFSDTAPAGEEAGPPDAPNAGATKTGDINIIVVADADMLSDPMWVREVRVGGMSLGFQQISDNGSFLINAVDNMTGSSDLISVRARGSAARPFTLVQEIRAAAEKKYLTEQQALEAKRREAEQRIAELQRARPDQGGMILTPEQQAEIDRFREELLTTSGQLRDVNYNLRKDVERLGLRLKIINIGPAPLAVFVAAIGLAGARAARRRAHRAQLGAARAT
ncbi:MAG: GldG family protein [Phycisphaerales bacterium]|nr:GldG family protein [Phycisphaerales bacterium]